MAKKIDKASKIKTIEVLSGMGFSNFYDSDYISQYCHYDISALCNDQRISIEVKNRSWKYPSDSKVMRGINSCELYKVEKNREYVKNGIYDQSLLITIYPDKVMRITNISCDYELDKKWANKTTCYQNREEVEKIFVDFKDYVEIKLK